jgi:glycosyltransferase involved in cell wall biosynthesis
MNIFVIPSWYPNEKNPISGIFVREEVVAIAEDHPDLSIVVSIDGSNEFFLDPRRPLQIICTGFKSLWAPKLRISNLVFNLVEMRAKCFGWPVSIFHGNLYGLIRVHRENFIKATKLYGKPQIIHAHVTYPAGWIAMLLSQEFKVPYIIKECMGPFPFQKRRFIDHKGKLTKWIHDPLKKAQQVIVMSRFLANLIKAHDLPVHKIIPYPVDERRFKSLPHIVRPALDRVSFFTLCSLSHEKGVDDLLHGIANAISEAPNIFFTIAGSGPIEYYKNLAISLGISKHIEWLGPLTREEAIQNYDKSDAFIMLSHFDTFGMVYVEALAMGKPIIATRCGGPEDIVVDINGLLVDIGDIRAISSAIIQISRTHFKYDPVAIRADFMARFSRTKIINDIVKCYQEILRN